jgi:hypothetical protein
MGRQYQRGVPLRLNVIIDTALPRSPRRLPLFLHDNAMWRGDGITNDNTLTLSVQRRSQCHGQGL